MSRAADILAVAANAREARPDVQNLEIWSRDSEIKGVAFEIWMSREVQSLLDQAFPQLEGEQVPPKRRVATSFLDKAITIVLGTFRDEVRTETTKLVLHCVSLHKENRLDELAELRELLGPSIMAEFAAWEAEQLKPGQSVIG